MPQDDDHDNHHPLPLWEAVEHLGDVQRIGWLNGQPTAVEQLLAEHPALADDSEACFYLIYNEWLIRQELGESVRAEEFLQRFPDFQSRLQQQWELSAALQLSDGASTARFDDDKKTGWQSATPSDSNGPAQFPETERFEPLQQLGSGGMGTVYAAYDRSWQQNVAIKTLHREDTTALFRLKQEFRTLAQLQHPHLIQFYELFASGPQPFFTMELVEGVDFVSHCCSSSGNSPRAASSAEKVREALRQLFAGLDALHRGGKLHCDIKPSNVLVTRGGRVVLLDFGLAVEREQRPDRPAGAYLRGTLPYVAPEVLLGQRASAAADYYSVGVLLYLVLTGRLPFPTTAPEMLAAKHRDTAPAPSETVPGLPEDLDRLCQDLLRRNPHQRPSARSVAERLGTGSAEAWMPPRRTRSEEVFVGRRRERALLLRAYRHSGEGKPARVLLGGRSGVGKTALLGEFLRCLQHRRGVLILRGQCYDQESVPFKAFDALVDRLSLHWRSLPAPQAERLLPAGITALARMFPVLKQVPVVASACRDVPRAEDPQKSRGQAIEALRELFLRLTEQQRVIVAIDDLQWGDADSAQLIRELFDHPKSPPLLLVACCRRQRGEKSEFLEQLDDSPSNPSLWSESLWLECLPPGESRQLAQHYLDQQVSRAHTTASRIAEISGGDPFLVGELAWFGDVFRGPENPDQIDCLLLSRLGQLSEDARRVLQVVAVAGQPLDPRDACRAAQLAEADQQKLLSQLQFTRFITVVREPDSPRQVRIYHDRLRESLVGQLSEEAKRGHRLSLARTLEESGRATPETLVNHYLAADHAQSAWNHARAAADRVSENLAFQRAADLYRLALDTGCGTAAERRSVGRQLADALSQAGQSLQSAAEYEALLEQASGHTARELRRLAAEQYLTAGQIRQCNEFLWPLLEELKLGVPKTPTRMLVKGLWLELQLRQRGLETQLRRDDELSAETLERLDTHLLAMRWAGIYDFRRAFVLQRLLIHDVLRVGEPRRLALTLLYELLYAAGPGPHTRPRVDLLLGQCERLMKHMDEPVLEAASANARGAVALIWGQWRQALQRNDQASHLYQEVPETLWFEKHCADLYSAMALFFLGRFGELNRRIETRWINPGERGTVLIKRWMQIGFPNAAWLASDDPEGAKEELDRAIAEYPPQPYSFDVIYVEIAEFHRRLYVGTGQRIWDDFQRARRRVRRSGTSGIALFRMHLMAVEAACALLQWTTTGDRRLRKRAGRLAVKLEKNALAAAKPQGQLVAAQLCYAEGDAARAAELFLQAHASFEAEDMALHTAVAELRYGEAIGGDDGRAAITSACAAMTRQGIANPDRMAAMIAPITPPVLK